MLRQFQIAFMKQFCTIDHGVHQKIFTFRHVFHFFPSKYSVLWQTFPVLHDFLTGCPLFLIYEITDQKVNCLWTSEQFI